MNLPGVRIGGTVAGALVMSIVASACAGSRVGGGKDGDRPRSAAASQSQPGQEPLHITVGWQPYYTASWSALVIKELELWKKYLPPGSVVQWEVGLQGAVITNNMLAGKYQIGYAGDMPAIVATTKRNQGDVRIVNLNSWTNQQCNIFAVRADAPDFSSPEDAIRWLDGKRLAVPKGSCSDRFAQEVLAQENVKPAEYLNQSIEVITSNLRAGKLDAAVLWEPTATRVTQLGEKTARIVATGADFGLYDASAVLMRKDFMDQYPETVTGWLKAEIEAQQFLVSNYPTNACKVAEWATKNSSGYDKKLLWYALYGLIDEGRSRQDGIRFEGRVTLDGDVQPFFKRSAQFLLNQKVISRPVPEDAIVQEPLKQAIQELGVSLPVGTVERHPISAYPCGTS